MIGVLYNFTSRLLHIHAHRTSPYHPQTDGLHEASETNSKSCAQLVGEAGENIRAGTGESDYSRITGMIDQNDLVSSSKVTMQMMCKGDTTEGAPTIGEQLS